MLAAVQTARMDDPGRVWKRGSVRRWSGDRRGRAGTYLILLRIRCSEPGRDDRQSGWAPFEAGAIGCRTASGAQAVAGPGLRVRLPSIERVLSQTKVDTATRSEAGSARAGEKSLERVACRESRRDGAWHKPP